MLMQLKEIAAISPLRTKDFDPVETNEKARARQQRETEFAGVSVTAHLPVLYARASFQLQRILRCRREISIPWKQTRKLERGNREKQNPLIQGEIEIERDSCLTVYRVAVAIVTMANPLRGLTLLFTVFVVLLSIHHALAARELSSAHHEPNPTGHSFQTKRPFNIAHRGDNGELPEETAEAYQRAIEVGADFIETDISATKDGVLICIHDVILDVTTDVVNHKEFADRNRTYVVEGVNVTGIFTVDLTWAEIKTLKAVQRWQTRDHSYDGKFDLITFEEYITIALEAPRVVGIYPEIKDPVFVNAHVKWPGGKNFEDIFIETLLKYGYTGTYMSKEWLKQPLFIQSFAPTSLIYASNFTNSPLVFLIDSDTVRTQDTNQSFAEITSDDYLDYISQFIVGIGPWKDSIVPPGANNFLTSPTDLVTKAHKRNLQVHPYTFRNENEFLHFDFVEDPYEEYAYWLEIVGVDGLFTDFPQSLHNYQEWANPLRDNLPLKMEKVHAKIVDLF